MRRAILQISFLLMAGAVVNVIVACGLFYAFHLKNRSSSPYQWPKHEVLESSEVNEIWHRFGGPSQENNDQRLSGRTIDLYGGASIDDSCRLVTITDDAEGLDSQSYDEIWEYQWGWPARSLCYQIWTGDWSAHAALNVSGLRFARNSDDLGDVWVPCRPLIAGFVFNTIIYTGIIWIFIFIPFACRRLIRQRRGKCTQCGYPVGTSPQCTECGARVNANPQQHSTGP
ncbi:MAG TPA: hypothetical protein VG711_06070 [Phycisphaerales bacterium]|nr:hypothetical protein [Phycisphaerales bacterium]